MRTLLATLLVSSLFVPKAMAQLGPLPGPGILPPASIVAPDTPIAVELDPAALVFLQGGGLLYTHGDSPANARQGVVSDSVTLGGSVRGRVGFGLGFSHVRPDSGARYGRFSLGLAAAAGRMASFGLAVRHVASSVGPDPTTLDLSASLRPSSAFGLSFVASNVLGPAGLAGTNGQTMPATFVFAVAARPYRDDLLFLEAAYLFDTDQRRGGRFYVATSPIHLLRIGTTLDVTRVSGMTDLRGLVGLELRTNGLYGAGGVTLASAQDSPGWYGAAGIVMDPYAGPLAAGRRMLEIDVHDEVGARRILGLVLALERAALDRSYGGVLLRLRRTDLGMAAAQEIHQMVAYLESLGKTVVCQLEEPRGSELYACANAHRTWIDPAGHLRLVGPSMNVVLLGGLLANLGLRADFVRAGEYKSAPEQLENETLSPPAREQEAALVHDLHDRLVQDLAADRTLDRSTVSSLVDRGPLTAGEAVQARLVDAVVDGDDLARPLREALPHPMRRVEAVAPEPDRRFGVPRRVAVVVVDGNIVDGENVDIPFVGVHASGSDTVVAALDRIASDRTVGAVVLRVDSGGGSALASDRIHRAVLRLAEHKPVVASLGSVAASGGYYVAAAAREIYADPGTVTGSIGVFYGKVDLAGLASRLDVHVEEFRVGNHAGAETPFRPYTADERARLEELVQDSYRLFLRRVAEGRHRTVEEIEPLARGRVYSGDAAVENGLVDHLGGFGAAIARARELGELDADAEVVLVPERPRSLFDYLMEGDSEDPGSTSARLGAVGTVIGEALEAAIFVSTLGEGRVLAMPDVVVAP